MKPSVTIRALLISLVCTTFAVSNPSHADGRAVAEKYDCFKCHDSSAKKKAPSFTYISNAYKGRSDAVGRIQNPIRNGIKSYFLWQKMPAHPQMSPAELQELTQWILQH